MQPIHAIENELRPAPVSGTKRQFTSASATEAPGLSLQIEGRIARLALNDSGRGNLLTLANVVVLRELLAALATERLVELVVIEGEAGVFCSGPDLTGLYRARADGADAAREFARVASALVVDIARLRKPVLALMDGVVVGGGLALGCHATYRVVTERTRIALPQTAIGLVPDLGLSRLLSRAPGSIGPYLCLSGTGIGPADAIFAGFADGFIHSDRIEQLLEKLANPFAGDIEGILNAHAADPGEGTLAPLSARIATVFEQSSVIAVMTSLSGVDAGWAREAKAAIASGSPVAMQLALALIKQAGELRRLEDCLRAEHHFVCKLLDSGEAFEGIGSRLVEPGRLPRWLAARPEDINAEILAPFLTPLLPGDGLSPAPALDS